jgi:cytochrome c5
MCQIFTQGMKKKLPVLLFLSCGIAFFACDKKVGKLPVVTTVVSVNACDTITYTKHIKPIFDQKCISCHTANNSGPDMSTYDLLKSRALDGKLKARAIDGNPSIMPQGGPKLPDAQLNLIQCWINNGAKEK